MSDNDDDDHHSFDDDIDQEDLELILSQTVQSAVVPTKKSKECEARIDKLQSQQINFTSIPKENEVLPSLKGSTTVLVNNNQRGNPLLQHLRIRFVFTDSIAPAHYILNDNCCALFLSLIYHDLNPNYIYDRVAELQNKYQLCLLIVLVDHLIYESLLKELTIMAVRMNFTLLLAWTSEEAARHIENFRFNFDKSPDIIMGKNFDETNGGKKSQNNPSQNSLVDALASINRINRTDAITLLSTFDTFENIVQANPDELLLCPGISMVKAKRLNSIFNRPFIKK